MRAKSYRCERDLRAAESKILKLAQVKFHYAAERNFILGKWLLEGNKTALIRFKGRYSLPKIGITGKTAPIRL